MCFPRKGTLTLTLGMGVGGDHLGPPKSQTNHQKSQKILQNLKKSLKEFLGSIFVPSEGNFDIDAGDGGGKIPQIPKNLQLSTHTHNKTKN